MTSVQPADDFKQSSPSDDRTRMGYPALSPQHIQGFHQSRLVRVTHGRLAIRLNPFGMLDSQRVVHLLPQVRVCILSVIHKP